MSWGHSSVDQSTGRPAVPPRVAQRCCCRLYGITAGAASSQSQSNNAVPSRLEEEARLTPKHVRCESEGENGEVVCVLDDPLCWETQEVMRVPRDGLDHKMRHLHRG